MTLLAINGLTGVVVGFTNAHIADLPFDWKAALISAGFAFVAASGAVFGFKSLDLVGARGVLATKSGIGPVDPAKAAKVAAVDLKDAA